MKAIVAGTAGDTTRLECARRIGAVRVVNIQEQRIIDAIHEETGGGGVSPSNVLGIWIRSVAVSKLYGPWGNMLKSQFAAAKSHSRVAVGIPVARHPPHGSVLALISAYGS